MRKRKASIGGTKRQLVTWGCQGDASHDEATHVELARRAARFLRLEYAGRLEDFTGSEQPYCVPRDTICGNECGRHLDVAKLDENCFLGGWVPQPLLATKAIVHRLAPGEAPPAHWPDGFTRQARNLVLLGFTAFTREGAVRSGRRLLEDGPVRIKAVGASGGTQQRVVRNLQELSEAIDGFDRDGSLQAGLVLEENLSKVCTYSVGRIRLGDTSAVYIGTQDLTQNNEGKTVYGGSTLQIMRGDFTDLGEVLPPAIDAVCRQAITFDRLAEEHLKLVASRRNYDVATGYDAAGRPRVAVLEQSWRIGGATSAELVALEAFERDPTLRQVRASSVERYGEGAVPPTSATIYFQGNDSTVGPLLKYAILQDER
ncbi:DUF3182 family protein [Nitratireductor sp. ZSWI3]|uniref:DUF3182 family protein n=1 Tax=Nitratireductor sp. ZSWI3 TaxID=2966359 RepID=UPI00214FC519|nr:DUF3182 family protein [Nitratireductor sp. ZSWI3]MCR4264689.1 DUF3182 family protein [Nitratireductor sp. ZSWI3]